MRETQILSLLVKNRPNVLTRVTTLCGRRGFNIDSLSVCATEDENFSRVTMTLTSTQEDFAQIKGQLEKQIDVAKVQCLNQGSIMRELLIAKINAPRDRISEIVDICKIFGAKAVDTSQETMILELTGTTEKIDAFLEMILSFGLLEMARTGGAALERGKGCIKEGI